MNGAGMGVTTIKPDGAFAECVRPGGSVPIFTLRNLTIDMQALAALTVGLEIVDAGIALLIAENVEILDSKKGAIEIYNRGKFRGTNLRLVGAGGHISHFTGSTECTINGCEMEGGQYGFVNVAAGGIDLTGIDGRFDYWASPTYEAVTATAYAPTYADVASHVAADRSLYDVLRYLSPVTTFDASATLPATLVRQWDRVEMADGRWTQVIDFDSLGAVLDNWRAAGSWRPIARPSGTATVYRVTMGRLIGVTGNRLFMQSGGEPPAPLSPRWRSVTGETMALPTVGGDSRFDIIRAGGANRDTDTGGIHITETAIGARVTDCEIVGGWSDTITLRGRSTLAQRCTTSLGQDMGFTVDGTDDRIQVFDCTALYTGRSGFACLGGPVDLNNCHADGNGTINDGSGDYGFTTTQACVGSTMIVTGWRNLDGLMAGAITTPTPKRTVSTLTQVGRGSSRPRARTLRRRF